MSKIDLVGNALCLDFANTVNKRPAPDADRLASIDGLARWAAAVGLPLTAETSRQPSTPDTNTELAAARHLREAIYRVFSTVASGRDPDPADLAPITAVYAPAVTSAELRRDGSRFDLHWPPPYTIPRITWAVAASAVRLLLDGPTDRIGECPSCRWLFLDTSRGGRRRWCSMAVCGARVKARRYYANSTG